MRGQLVDQSGLFSYVDPEHRIPPQHPLRRIRVLVREVLAALTHSLAKLYASEGDLRCRRSNCSARCCSRPSMASARSGS